MRRILIVLVALVALTYTGFEARRLILGPVIEVTSPTQGSATSTTLLAISGTAHNISFLTVNDKPAFTDVLGHFSVTLSPVSGYTIITVAAVDRFGRHAQQKVEIEVRNYCPIS
ncbi:MAG: hypothetical protein QG621_132 [Patescibacteria group bacterium]|jgi:hypothetical protein|nr:hypothetical protein [Patescibacteria group bacterium]